MEGGVVRHHPTASSACTGTNWYNNRTASSLARVCLFPLALPFVLVHLCARTLHPPFPFVSIRLSGRPLSVPLSSSFVTFIRRGENGWVKRGFCRAAFQSGSIHIRVCRHAHPAHAFTARVHYCDPNPSKDKTGPGSHITTQTRAPPLRSPLAPFPPHTPFPSLLLSRPSNTKPTLPRISQSYTPIAPLSLDLHQIRPRGTRRPRVLQLPGQHHHAVARLHEAQRARVLEDGALLCFCVCVFCGWMVWPCRADCG